MKIKELALMSMWKILIIDDAIYAEDITSQRIKIDDDRNRCVSWRCNRN